MKLGCLFQRSSAGIYLTYSRGSIEEVCIFRLFKYTHLNADNVFFFFSFWQSKTWSTPYFTSLLEHLRYTRKKRKKNQDYETTVPCTTSSSSSSICSCLCDVNNLKLEVQVKQVTPPTNLLPAHPFRGWRQREGKGREPGRLHRKIKTFVRLGTFLISSSHLHTTYGTSYLLPRRCKWKRRIINISVGMQVINGFARVSNTPSFQVPMLVPVLLI